MVGVSIDIYVYGFIMVNNIPWMLLFGSFLASFLFYFLKFFGVSQESFLNGNITLAFY